MILQLKDLEFFTFCFVVFLPMKECVDRLSTEKREEYERLSYRLQDMVFPFVVVHPHSEDVVRISVLHCALYVCVCVGGGGR